MSVLVSQRKLCHVGACVSAGPQTADSGPLVPCGLRPGHESGGLPSVVRRLPALLVLLLALCAGAAHAQPVPPDLDETFPVEAIDPALLLEGVPAVVRLDSRRFEVESASEAVKRVRRVVTVFRPEGREYGRLSIYYDSFREIEDLEGRLRGPDGEVIRSLDEDDIGDYSAIRDISLYEEWRVRTATLSHSEYPYTVEFEYEVARDGLISWPTWIPQRGGAPVEHSLFEIDAPSSLPARYAALHTDERPTRSRHGDRRTWRWSDSMLAPKHRLEPYSPPWREQAPMVYTAPTFFEIAGRRGAMASWEQFGQWYYELSKGRTALPPALADTVHALTDGVEDRREKIRRLYRYLQSNTRYVSIQLGIGGWQPFSASYVYEHGYGDCKALVNYMQALLEEVGIASHQVLIRSGISEPSIPPRFPSNPFNHLVLAVPMEDGERLWLECTDMDAPFAHLGASNEDRYALLIEDGTSRLVRTPETMPGHNRQTRRARVQLNAEGHALAEVTTRYTGNQQDFMRDILGERSAHEQRRQLRQMIQPSNVQVTDADFSEMDARTDTMALPIRFTVRSYASRTGKRMFLRPNLMQRWGEVPPPMEEKRTQPVEFFGYAFADSDTVEYVLPDGFAVEAVPDPVEVEAPFAHYRAETEVLPGGTLQYRRGLTVRTPDLPAEQYDAFRRFMKQVARADRAQVVLVKQ